jgi:DNA replication protein DnaC
LKYTRESYLKAEETLKYRREKAETEREQRMNEIKYRAPEIATLQNSLSFSQCEIVKTIGGERTANAKEKILELKERNKTVRQTIREILKTCGYPEDYLQYHFHCPICNDTGYREGARCSCMEKLLVKYTVEELNENCTIKLRDFSEFKIEFYPEISGNIRPRDKMADTYNFCKEYADNFGENSPSLFFFGKTGLGKTLLSSCIANSLLSEGYNVVFGSILNIFRRVEDEHFGRAEGNTTEVIINADLVILDDLGSEFQTSFTDSVLYEIINGRINLNKPTIISTNLTLKELDSKYNDRIVSRLTGCFKPIMFVGRDVRQEVRKMGL